MDGMATIEEVDCGGVVDDVQVQQDGTIQMYLDFLDDWESSLLQNVYMLYPMHEILILWVRRPSSLSLMGPQEIC
eukprot:10734562-Ditylum_brightwellii.AAC.1